MKADLKINATLSSQYYRPRMGSTFVMPDTYISQISSEIGGVLITDQKGKVLWSLNSHFIPLGQNMCQSISGKLHKA